MSNYNNFLEDLEEAEKKIWQSFVEGTANKKSKFNYPTLCNFRNNQVFARTMILRKAYPKKRLLMFYTDIRSKKFSDIKVNENILLHVYNERNRIQLQCYGQASVEFNTSNTKKFWNTLNVFSKQNYMSLNPPETKVFNYKEKNSLVDEKAGYLNFGIINILINQIDCLQLKNNNNKRALIKYGKFKTKKMWIVA